jgi:hypothetical protein
MYTLPETFYIPLVDLAVDLEQIKQEVYSIINPQEGDYAVTCQQQDQDLDVYDFKKYAGQRVYNPNSRFLLATGEMDTDIVYWPKCLQGSYIQQFGEIVTEYLGLTAPRCRLSIRNNPKYPSNIGFHVDNHTPYRVHIALETTEHCIWRFREDAGSQEYQQHQPVSPQPVLIQTQVQHDIFVPPGSRRLHLWYQFHGDPDPKFIESLIEKARY